MAKQPGVMFYFDVRPCIKRLNINEKGLLFEAILDYSELGVEPNLDGALGIAWDFIRPKLDRDAARYGKQVEQKQYAVFAREARKRGQEPVPFDEWKTLPDIERNRLVSADTERYPTSTPTSTPASAPTTTSNGSKAGKPPRSHSSGKEDCRAFGRFGWVKLTDAEYNDLVHEFGETEVKRCISYIDESAQSTGNKNRWKDWSLIIRRCSNGRWGLSTQSAAQGAMKTAADYAADESFV